MRKLILLLMISAFSCGAPFKYGDIRDHQVTQQKEDPLLESIKYYREMDCLRNCSDSDKWKCD